MDGKLENALQVSHGWGLTGGERSFLDGELAHASGKAKGCETEDVREHRLGKEGGRDLWECQRTLAKFRSGRSPCLKYVFDKRELFALPTPFLFSSPSSTLNPRTRC